jgi:hypothetical protein
MNWLKKAKSIVKKFNIMAASQRLQDSKLKRKKLVAVPPA